MATVTVPRDRSVMEQPVPPVPIPTGHPPTRADVIVVGGGPAGAAAGFFLARAGLDVVVVEKEHFPREKVCGDGLTPRAVKALRLLELHDEAEGKARGWQRQDGLRMYGGGIVWDLPWPRTDAYPAHSVTATRALHDATLAANAASAGAQVFQGYEATAPLWLGAAEQQVAGLAWRDADGERGSIRAPLVVVADGGSSRFAVQLGLHRDDRRPMGVAVRGYWRSPRSTMEHMEGFLDLQKDAGRQAGPAEGGSRLGEQLPGYGWIFPLADGLVNVGWGLISTSAHFRTTNYRQVLLDWVAGLPESWQLTPQTQVGRPRSAGLPMAHNRHPHVAKGGALLIGDSGGMVNPFNGEGISYAIEAAAFAAEAAEHALRTGRTDALQAYPRRVAQAWGGYFTLGRVFLAAMGHPTVVRLCTTYGMPRRRIMEFTLKTMAHLLDSRPRDATDALIGALARMAPAA